MRKPRIGFFGWLHGGGAERVLVNLANSTLAAGHTVVMISPSRRDDEYPLNPSMKRYVLAERTGKEYLGRMRTVREIRRICKEESLDALVSFNEFLGGPAAFGLPAKSIISIRNDPKFQYRKLKNRIGAKTLTLLADGCVFQTEEARAWFPKQLQKKSIILPNPVNNAFYQVPWEPAPGRIVTCGRLMDQKNHRLLIDAFHTVTERNPNLPLELRIYGVGPLEEELQNQIHALRLDGSVKLMGRTDNVPEVLRHAELFVLSSNAEGSPNALMEAMAVGVPCVSTDCPCGGPRMLLKDTGAPLVPVGDRNALADGIETMLLDEERKISCTRKAKETAARFTQDRVTAGWISYIERVVGAKS